MDKHLAAVIDLVAAFVATITPAALGACVSMAYERGLTWGDRFTRLLVGIAVSYFTTRVIDALLLDDPLLLQSVSFTMGMIAYKATPQLTRNITDIVVTIPGWLAKQWLGKSKDEGQ
ncbi:MAG: hypothetical protein K2Y20_13760 [Sphingomonas sp.]|nr:hypothetical protein [Sphingomonas sp.]